MELLLIIIVVIFFVNMTRVILRDKRSWKDATRSNATNVNNTRGNNPSNQKEKEATVSDIVESVAMSKEKNDGESGEAVSWQDSKDAATNKGESSFEDIQQNDTKFLVNTADSKSESKPTPALKESDIDSTDKKDGDVVSIGSHKDYEEAGNSNYLDYDENLDYDDFDDEDEFDDDFDDDDLDEDDEYDDFDDDDLDGDDIDDDDDIYDDDIDDDLYNDDEYIDDEDLDDDEEYVHHRKKRRIRRKKHKSEESQATSDANAYDYGYSQGEEENQYPDYDGLYLPYNSSYDKECSVLYDEGFSDNELREIAEDREHMHNGSTRFYSSREGEDIVRWKGRYYHASDIITRSWGYTFLDDGASEYKVPYSRKWKRKY